MKLKKLWLITALFAPSTAFCRPKTASCGRLLDASAPKLISADMKNADGYAVTESDIVIQALEKLNIRGPLLLRAFNGEYLNQVLKYGTVRESTNSIYAFTEQELRGSDKLALPFFDYLNAYKVRAVAVYDEAKLATTGVPWQYEFVSRLDKRAALKAVVLLKY